MPPIEVRSPSAALARSGSIRMAFLALLLAAGLGACRASPEPRRAAPGQELEPLAPALRAELEDPGFPLSWQVG